MRNNNSVNHSEFGSVVQDEKPFKAISYLELWRPICSADQNHLCNAGRRRHEEQFRDWTSGSGGNVIKRHFLSGAPAALLFSGAEQLVQFWYRLL